VPGGVPERIFLEKLFEERRQKAIAGAGAC
jgi:hypothetical protein